jgi:hypothetical protein
MTPTEFDIRLREALTEHGVTTLALGFVRYERLRTMSPRQFAKLHAATMTGKSFDDLVDEAIEEGGFR